MSEFTTSPFADLQGQLDVDTQREMEVKAVAMEAKRHKRQREKKKKTKTTDGDVAVAVDDDDDPPIESKCRKRSKPNTDKPPPSKKKNVKKKEKKVDPEHERLVNLLSGYGRGKILGPFLKSDYSQSLDRQKLRKLKVDRLQEIEEDVEDILQNHSNVAMGDAIVRQGMQTLENIVDTQTRLRVGKGPNHKGTTATCFDNERWAFLLERCKIRAGLHQTSLDPAAELTLITLQTAWMVHEANSNTPGTDLTVKIEEVDIPQ